MAFGVTALAPVTTITRYPDARPSRGLPQTPVIGDTPRKFYVREDGVWEVWEAGRGLKIGPNAWRTLGPFEEVIGREVTVDGFSFAYFNDPHRAGFGVGTPRRGWYMTPESVGRMQDEVNALMESGAPLYVPMPTMREFIHSDAQHAVVQYQPMGVRVSEEWLRQSLVAHYRAYADAKLLDVMGNNDIWRDPINEIDHAGDPKFDLLEWPGAGDLDNIEKCFGIPGNRHYWVLFVDPSTLTIVLLRVPFIGKDNHFRDNLKDVGRNPWLHKLGLAALQFIPVAGQLATVAIVQSGVFRRQEQRLAQDIAENEIELAQEMYDTRQTLLSHEAQVAAQSEEAQAEAQAGDIASSPLPGIPKGTATVLLVGGSLLFGLVMMIGLYVAFRGK